VSPDACVHRGFFWGALSASLVLTRRPVLFKPESPCRTPNAVWRPALCSSRTVIRPREMILLLRFFIVLSLALLAMQGARAHARNADAMQPAWLCVRAPVCNGTDEVSQAASYVRAQRVSIGDGQLAPHHHRCLCCMTDCGAHCAALIVTIRVDVQGRADGLPRPRAVPRYAGVMRAPPVRPPIPLV
jgi:hypothetical protein